MANNYEAIVRAVLDQTQFNSDMDKLQNGQYELRNLHIEPSNLSKEIQDALNSQRFNIDINPVINSGGSGNSGKNFAQAVETAINTGIGSHSVTVNLKDALQFKGIDSKIADSIIKSVSKDIDSATIKLKSFDAQFEETIKNGRRLQSIRFVGIDEDGKTLNILSKIDKKTGEVASTVTHVTQKFDVATTSTNKTKTALEQLLEIQKKISTLDLSLTKLDQSKDIEQIKVLERLISELSEEYVTLFNASSGDLSHDDLLAISRAAEESGNKMAILEAKLKDAKKTISSLDVITLDNKMSTWLVKNTKASKDFGSHIQYLRERLKGIDITSDDAADQLEQLAEEFKSVQQSAIAAGKTGNSFIVTLKKSFSSLIGIFSVAEVFNKSVQTLKDMYEQVYEIDTAMTNLLKVTDETSSRYDIFLKDSAQSAKELGRSVSSLVEQSATWAKLGYSIDESEELAKLSSIYANVAEVDDAKAVSDMVTAMKAFNIEAKNAVNVIDPLNELGNNFATSAADLGTGLSKSASAMSAAGTDMYKTLAMLTGGAEITQNAGEFGNFLKVSSMRIRGMKGELEELGEEVDESVDSISKVQTQILNITSGKVNIFDDNGEFRDYYEIMEDIAEIYNDLTSTEQASLTEILFGKMRGNQGQALIQAFQSGQIQKAYKTALESSGSAAQEQAKWMESLEAKTQELQAAWQELAMTFLDSDFLKGLIDSGTGLLELLTDIIDTIGTLPTLGATIGAAMSFKNVGELINQFRYLIILRIEYAHKALTNGNMNEIMRRLAA